MSGVGQYIKDMPPWAKGVLALAGVGIAVALGLTVKNAIKKAKDKKSSNDAVNEAKSELAKLAASGIKPSYTASQYKIWANAAAECFSGWGTCSGDSIFVNMKNDADVLSLITAFGTRTISSGTWNPEPDTTGDLSTVIRSELSISDIQTLNNSLSKKGISYKF